MKIIIQIASFLGECFYRTLVAIAFGIAFFLLYILWHIIAAFVFIAIISLLYIFFYKENVKRNIVLSLIGVGVLCLVFFTSIPMSFGTEALVSYVGILIYSLQFKR